ncbi:MAG: response regulator transcription factor [Saprospiraceae bacterium]|nr:response regulator transcription factor [Saprospiraceae bacterium]
MSSKIQVALADADVLCRVGLSGLLAKISDTEIVGEAGNTEELLRILQDDHVDVVIVDYNQPKYFDYTIAAQIKKISTDTQILVISSDSRRERIYQVLEDGVSSFLTKQCDENEILDAIAATAKGEKFYCHKILDMIIERSFPSKDEDCTPTSLTPREKEILTLVAKGKVAKEIAAELHISPHTIYTHRKNILKKLQLTSPTEMVVYALEHGLIDLQSLN